MNPDETPTRVENTDVTAGRLDALPLLLGVGHEAIEVQERQGQAQLARSEQLPAECPPDSRAALEAAGVVFGEPSPGDPLFVDATLPPGWRKASTNHHMHTDLLDERGRRRAGIFYKAASYDRCATMKACTRFSANIKYADAGRVPQVSDGDTVVWRGDPILVSGGGGGGLAATDAAWAQADAWLDARYPDWRSLTAYWDAP